MKSTSYKLTVFAEEDRPGILASILLELSKHGANVLSMTAATGAASDGRSWGRAELKITLRSSHDPSELCDAIERACSDDVSLKLSVSE